MVFLDVAGAFDNVSPELLIQDLEVPSLFRRFVMNMTAKCHISFVSNGDLSQSFITCKGTPQDAALSPLLFNIYVRNLFRVVHEDSRILQYADDIVIFSTASDPRVSIHSINLSLERIHKFLFDRGLEITPSKSKRVFFSRRRRDIAFPGEVRDGNQTISWGPSARFLGIDLDSTLAGKLHIAHLIRRGNAVIKKYSRL